eukprot:gene9935-2256_t
MSEAIYHFEDVYHTPDSVMNYKPYKSIKLPIIIDNGSYTNRSGWSGEENPKLIFHPLVGKFRGKTAGISIGNDIQPYDYQRLHVKSAFEFKDYITNFDVQESIFDYIFFKLGINTNKIEHPILITEKPNTPISSRKGISELLFECYQIPSLCFGIDSLFSYYKNSNQKNGLILSSGFNSTHILPFVNGKFDSEKSRKIPIGGFHATDLMLKLMQLKYPMHRPSITVENVQQLKEHHTIVSNNYLQQIRSLSRDRDYFNKNTIIIQLPEEPEVKKMSDEKRKIASERLKGMISEKKEKKKEENENILNELIEIKKLKKMNQETFEIELKKFGFENENKLISEIKKLKKVLDIEIESDEEEEIDEKIIEIPDSQLTKEEIKKKRRMKLLIGGKKAREKKRKEKEIEQEENNKKRKLEEEFKSKNPEKYLENLKEKRKKILNQLDKARAYQNDLKNRKSNISKQRLKAMASAIDEENEDENFGRSSEDWEIYNLFNKEITQDDEIKFENYLKKIDSEISEIEESLGIIKNDYYSLVLDHRMNLNPQQMNQLHLTLERFRVPEIIFQPSIIGKQSCGLIEGIENVLSLYSKDIQNNISQNLFLCGGNLLFKNMKNRIENDFRMIRPQDSKFNIIQEDSIHDSWNGASLFSKE